MWHARIKSICVRDFLVRISIAHAYAKHKLLIYLPIGGGGASSIVFARLLTVVDHKDHEHTHKRIFSINFH